MAKKWIMISGPYTHNAKTDADRVLNLKLMNQFALGVFKKGHVPIVGVNMALPMVEAAKPDDLFDALMMPVSLALAQKCDAVLRIGGPSAGADEEVAFIQSQGGRVYYSLAEIEDARPSWKSSSHCKDV